MSYSESHLSFNDLSVGQEWTSPGRTITDRDIPAFASFSGDFNPMHVDEEYARQTPFGRVIVHGFGVLSLASGLATITPPMRTIALLSIRSWSFLKPVFVGDTIRLVGRVIELTPKGKGRRGEVVWQRKVLNQDDLVVQEGQIVTLVEARSL